jgi:hypothetical protein
MRQALKVHPDSLCSAITHIEVEVMRPCKSYWALAHPSGKADFHQSEPFALEFS